MSFRRVFIWRCDECEREEVKESYKLPPQWTWGGNPIKHLCETCSDGSAVGENQERIAKHSDRKAAKNEHVQG